MTKQQALDTAAEHLLKQGCKAVDKNDDCRYRWYGRKCAIGTLIPDKLYKPSFEKKVVGSIAELLPQIFGNIKHSFLRRLQCVHDGYEPEEWPVELRNLARQYRLRIPACVKAALKGAEAG